MAIAQYREIDGRWVTPNGRPMVSRYRDGTNDWNTISACLTSDEYGLRGLALKGSVVDVGGYLGSVGIACALDFGVPVTIIEPVPWNAALIRENIAANGVEDRVTLIEGAVGRGGEPVDVWFGYRGNESAEHHAFVGNSSLAYSHGGELDHQTKTYTALGLGEIVERTGPIGLLKIDCEGGEWTFLGSSYVDQVERIVGEAHAVRGHIGADIVDLLAAIHVVTLSGDPTGTCGFVAVRR